MPSFNLFGEEGAGVFMSSGDGPFKLIGRTKGPVTLAVHPPPIWEARTCIELACYLNERTMLRSALQAMLHRSIRDEAYEHSAVIKNHLDTYYA